MAAVEFQLSRTMIDWIASEEGLTTIALAEQLMPNKKDKFLQGNVTKTAAEKLAKIGKIPFGYLFLENPPAINKPKIPDLRQTVSPVALSKDFFDTYNDIKYKIDWYKEHLNEFGIQYKLDFIGKYSINNDYRDVAQDISRTIGLDVTKTARKVTKDSYFSVACALIEKIGVLVFKNGIVKSNTSRRLDTSEFRGFCLIDDMVPAVFVNGSDAFSAQVFTLFHELAHIWVGKDGVSNWHFENKIEAFCNKVAAEVLMPFTLFKEKWLNESHLSEDTYLIASHTADYFKVSVYAVAIKAKTLNLIDEGDFAMIRKNSMGSEKKEAGGANPYAIYPYRNSPKLTDAVLSSAVSQQLPLREAANLLNIKAGTVVELYKKRKSNQ